MAKDNTPKIRMMRQDDIARFAIEDFGTVDIPMSLRREARLLAIRLGITPRQALDRLQADNPRPSITKQDDRAAPPRQNRPTQAQRHPSKANAPDAPKAHGRGSR